MEFEERLRKNGLKITPQRVAILKEIARIGHPTIEELYESILKDHPFISLATIYKNIFSLCEAGILREIKIKSQRQRYEISCGDHAHYICVQCGKLEDATINSKEIFKELETLDHFKISSVSLNFYGKCRDCVQNDDNSHH